MTFQSHLVFTIKLNSIRWSRLQGLFHKDKLRSGYYRVMRSERANNFQVITSSCKISLKHDIT